MSQFVKSILNYYAAFTETRFSNRSTLNYKWLDDANLTLDISFFSDFFRLWITKLENNDRSPVDIRANQFKREISSARFLQKLKELLAGDFNPERLQKCLSEEKAGKELTTSDEHREAFLEGTRAYNLALRKAIEQVIHSLQKEEIAVLEQQFRAVRLPAPTFNVPKFSQDIYDALQRAAADSAEESEYFRKAEACLKEREYHIVIYDLLMLLKQFAVAGTYGTSYLFFDSVQLMSKDEKKNPDYPLFFIEISFDTGLADCMRLTVPRDLIMLNTPAINSFAFQNVLTIPRAASFSGSIAHLRQLDSFLTGEYNLPPQTITTNDACFVPPPAENLPYLKYRFGLQIIKNEDKRILDYSELMTKIEKGEGSTIIDFVDGYLKEKVISTYDETNSSFREEYPKNSARFFYSDNPLPLNQAQKKILTALGNSKNRIVVIDGPPGTGKSHTIGAITYWANQHKKSIVITSHKKEALDVVERMLTDKFKSLHPHTKPSVIRITRNNDLSTLNTIDNSLSLPVIDGAARRSDEFNLEAVERDRLTVRESIEQAINTAINHARLFPEMSRKLLRFIQLEEELAVNSDELTGTPTAEIIKDLKRFEEFGRNPALADFDSISLDSLVVLYQRRHDIPRILEACNTINCQAVDQNAVSEIEPASLRNLKDFRLIVKRLAEAFDNGLPLQKLAVTELRSQSNELQAVIPTFKGMQIIRDRLKELADMNSFSAKLGLNKKYTAAEKKFRLDFPAVWDYAQKADIKPDKLQEQVSAFLQGLKTLKGNTPYDIEFVYSLSRQPGNFAGLTTSLNDLNGLKFDNILSALAKLSKKDKQKLTLKEIIEGLLQLDSLGRYSHNMQAVSEFQNAAGLSGLSYKELYLLLDRIHKELDSLKPHTMDALGSVHNYYGAILKRVGIDFSNIASLGKLKELTRDEQNLMEIITLHAELSMGDAFLPAIRAKLDELNGYNQRLTEHTNDLRLKGFQNHPADMARIKRQIANGQRLTSDQAKLLCSTYSCIIAEPEALFKFFPMDEGLIDILIFDEASQVSIAHSLSLILRAGQVLVFGDKYQYGAVGAVNVSRKYGGGYFKRIIDDYVREYNRPLTEEEKTKLLEEETRDIPEDDIFVSASIRDSELAAHKEWLKAFGIRMSTLDFCQEIRNYHTSLDEHFRCFPEIIDYSNRFFYQKAQIPLITNRLRTRPISEVLRFIKVETQGHSGKNVNLDEIEAIRKDLERLTADGYRGTICIITAFREQCTRTEHYLREKLPGFHKLKEENKLAVWFVGDVQGEERDIVYYSFVQDKKIDNADLRTIYPTPGGTADTINSLKMQRLNVGFSRAKDTMVFVHSMELGDYADSRLGDALKHYWDLLEETRQKDCFIEDEKIFGSPMEKDLYALIIQSDFYRKNRDSLKVIPQFDIGKYLRQEYKKYIPRYRVDFLLTLAAGGKEKSLILEYDGLEYHTKDPSVVRSLEDFKEEYLEYDITRQLELESYGYHFLRINKFTLLPKAVGQTRLDVLNNLLEHAFAV